MLDNTTFDYFSPTPDQLAAMSVCREAEKVYAAVLQANVPQGPDQTYLLRRLRDVAMWANVAITRQPDGAPRSVA